jgi:hydrogenase nickel incorporation protein HypA/HybF
VDDSVQFYWDEISRGTLCEGARLHFDRIPARLVCQTCGENYELAGDLVACPRCAGEQVKVVSGDEFRLDSIGVET